MSCPSVGDSRTEEDFVAHIRATVETDPQGKGVFICEPLNTPKSEGLVTAVAPLCGVEEELGKKGPSKILKSMASRAAFLPEGNHRIRLVYTPKQGSWLNPVELWFGMGTGRRLKRGRFTSTEEMKRRILAFIEFFNPTLAKSFRWTSLGKPLLT